MHAALGYLGSLPDATVVYPGHEYTASNVRHALTVDPVPLPDGLEVVVVDSGQTRRLAGSPYADRVAECAAAEAVIGPLRLARPGD